MDELKKDKHTFWIPSKPRFQIQEPDYGSRRKGKLIKEKPVYPTEKQIQKKMAKLSSGQSLITAYFKPNKRKIGESFEENNGEIREEGVKGPTGRSDPNEGW